VGLDYVVVRSKKRRKTLSLNLRKDGSIVIQAPWNMPKSEIDNFFYRKKDWVGRKIRESEEIQTGVSPKRFLPGEVFLFLGFSYPLMVDDRNNDGLPLLFSGHEFILNRNHLHRARVLFTEWYQEKAREYIEGKVYQYSRFLGLYPGRVRIGNAKSRWGSCSHNNYLTFTWRLIMAPGQVIDYVVIHELAHVKEKNHSKKFWDLLEKTIPDYRRRRLWLKENGHLLTV
jgi:hypothetical protein